MGAGSFKGPGLFSFSLRCSLATMVQKPASEMINGVLRIKWWKYRYVVLAALVVNVVLVNHFFFDSSFTEFIRPPPPPGSEAALGQKPAPPPNGTWRHGRFVAAV